MGRKKMTTSEYRQNLVLNRGKEFMEDFDSIFSGDITLAEISRKYKITKMRATQIFERLYGKKYREAQQDGQIHDARGKAFTFHSRGSKNLLVKVPEETYNALKAYAARNGISMSTVVRDSLAGFLEGNELPRISSMF